MTRIAGVLLDFYGTVVAEDDAVISATVEKIRVDVPDADPAAIGDYWWQTFSELCARAHGDTFGSQRALETASLEETLRHFGSDLAADELSQGLYDYWQAPEMLSDGLRFVSNVGLPLCVVSNIDRADLEAAFDHHGLAFDHVVTSQDARAYKPRPEMFGKALSQLAISASQVVHIGDSVSSDVRGAQAAGIRSVWVNRAGRAVPQDVEPWAVVGSLDEIRKLLRDGA